MEYYGVRTGWSQSPDNRAVATAWPAPTPRLDVTQMGKVRHRFGVEGSCTLEEAYGKWSGDLAMYATALAGLRRHESRWCVSLLRETSVPTPTTGFVTHPDDVPAALVERARQKVDARIAATEGRHIRQ